MSVHDFSTTLTSRIVNNQAISLEVPNTNFNLRLLGSTMPTNADVIQVGENGVPQIVMYPKPGEDGLIALCIRIMRGQNADYVPCFFRVVWKEKEGTKYPFIYLKESWVSPERIGHATSSSIEVVINGKRFSSFKSGAEDAPVYVPDGNLLCRYLWGTASALEVLHAAVQKKVESNIGKYIQQLYNDIRTLTDKCNYKSNQILLLQKNTADHVQMQRAVRPFCKMFGRLPTWMQPKSVRDLLEVTNSGK